MNNPRVLVIRGARVVDVDRAEAESADLLVRDGVIEAVGPPGVASPSDAETVDATGTLVHPGLINAHTHGHGSLGKGCGDRWTLELLLASGPWLSGGRNLEDRYLAAAINAAENLLKGCTACYDLFMELPAPTREGMERAVQAYVDAGMRVVAAPMLSDINLYDAVPGLRSALPDALGRQVDAGRPQPWEESLKTVEELAEAWRWDRRVARLALAPTIPLNCSDDFLRAIARTASSYDLPTHSHVAESKVQAIAGLQRYGGTIVGHLQSLGLMTDKFTVAHGVWLDTNDMDTLAAAGASVAANPGSNLRLGSGLPDLRAMLDAGINLGLGTDGSNSSDNQNMYEAMRLGAYVTRVSSPDPGEWLSARDAFRAATTGGAQALGLDAPMGRIAPGYQADLVFLDLGHVNWIPVNNVTNQLVNSEDAGAVRHVMVGGRWCVRDGALVTMDLAALRERAEEARVRLSEATGGSRTLAGQLEPYVATFCPALAQDNDYQVERYCGRVR